MNKIIGLSFYEKPVLHLCASRCILELSRRKLLKSFIAFTFFILLSSTPSAQSETKVIVTDGLAKVLQESRAWLKEHEDWQIEQDALKNILENVKKSIAGHDKVGRDEVRELKKHQTSKIKYEELIANHETFKKQHNVYKLRQDSLRKLSKDLEAALLKFESLVPKEEPKSK